MLLGPVGLRQCRLGELAPAAAGEVQLVNRATRDPQQSTWQPRHPWGAVCVLPRHCLHIVPRT